MTTGNILNNDPDSIRMRRNRSILSVTGAGVAAFGIWSVIRSMMEFSLGTIDETIIDFFAESDKFGEIIFFAVMFIVIITDVLLRFYIFFLAGKERRGQEKKMKLLLPTLLVASGSAFSVCIVANDIVVNADLDMINLVSMFVELTSICTLIELIVAAVDNRIILSRKRSEAAENAA